MIATNAQIWDDREVEILSLLRTSCTSDEISEILNKLGFNRTPEAVSRKSRRMKIRFYIMDEPTGDFSDEESKAIDEVINKRPSRAIESTQWSGSNTDLLYTNSDGVVDPPSEFWMERDHFQKELDPSVSWISGALPLKKEGLTKFIMLNDIHVPHNIPLNGIWDFVRDFQPDHMLLVGDIVNNDPFDHWAREKPARAKEMPKPKTYFKLCNDTFYVPMKEAAGKDCLVTHWIGNHEYWSSRAIEYMPEGEGYWEVWNNVEKGCVDLWVPSKGVANLGYLHFTHGDIIKGGKYHPWQFLNYFNRNIMYGHYHDVGTASHTAPIDMRDRHIARCNGCLEKYNPHFMENRPHNWQHAFSYGWVKPNGIFATYQVIIIEDKFVVNGKEYSSDL